MGSLPPSRPPTGPAPPRRSVCAGTVPTRVALALWMLFALGFTLFIAAEGYRELRFRAGAREVEGLVVPDPAGRKVLQVRDGQQRLEFPVWGDSEFDDWAWNSPAPALYHPDLDAVHTRAYSNAELLAHAYYLGLGCLCILVGICGWRRALPPVR